MLDGGVRSSADRHVAGLRGDPLEPGADRRVGLELEAALLSDVRVRVQRDVGDRVALGDEVAAATQPLLHPRERLVAGLAQARYVLLWHWAIGDRDEKARHCEVRLVAVLLEEQPLHDLGSLEAIL